jgi:hypothetical protein
LFEQATDMAWRVRLHNAPNIGMGGTITVNDSARQYPLARGTVATPLSGASIDVQDFDGNGQREILIGSSTSLYMLTKSGAADYIQSWVYPYDPRAEGNFVSPGNSGFDAVASGDVDGDGHREIFFALGPVIVKLDGVTRREVARYGNQGTTAPFGPYCTSLKYGDIDNDGVGELVCLGNDGGNGDPTHIYVLDARTMTLKWQSGTLAGGTSLALGNVVGGSGLQIVTSDGYVFDGTTHQNLWAYGPGFGSVIDVGDVSGDGVAKIVGVDPSGNAVVFSATLKSPIWQVTTPSATGTSALKVANLDGTGPAEILLGDGQWGNVRVYRYNTSTHVADAVSQINAVGDGVTAIAAGDVDGDGQMEMIWGEAWGALPPATLAIASWAPTPVLKWQGPDTVGLDGPFVGAKNATIGAGQNRIMFATPRSNSGYAGERIIALDPGTGSLALSSEIDSNWSSDRAFDVANVTGGSTDSMLLGTATLYNGYFAVYDFAGDAKTWTSAQVGDGVAVTHADLNHDSVDDVIGITSQGYVYAWDVHHQTLLWTSTQLSGGRRPGRRRRSRDHRARPDAGGGLQVCRRLGLPGGIQLHGDRHQSPGGRYGRGRRAGDIPAECLQPRRRRRHHHPAQWLAAGASPVRGTVCAEPRPRAIGFRPQESGRVDREFESDLQPRLENRRDRSDRRHDDLAIAVRHRVRTGAQRVLLRLEWGRSARDGLRDRRCDVRDALTGSFCDSYFPNVRKRASYLSFCTTTRPWALTYTW